MPIINVKYEFVAFQNGEIFSICIDGVDFQNLANHQHDHSIM